MTQQQKCKNYYTLIYHQISAAKVNPSAYEKSVIDGLSKEKVERRTRKRKKAKGPNPLSVRRGQKLSVKAGVAPAGVVSRSKVWNSAGHSICPFTVILSLSCPVKKRRLRLEKRKAVEQLLLAKVVQATSNQTAIEST